MSDPYFPVPVLTDPRALLPDVEQIVIVPNPQGLHARPVMRFVDLASQFKANVTIVKGDFVVNGKDPMEMMLLEATQGTELKLVAAGPDADEALTKLAELIEDGFGEM